PSSSGCCSARPASRRCTSSSPGSSSSARGCTTSSTGAPPASPSGRTSGGSGGPSARIGRVTENRTDDALDPADDATVDTTADVPAVTGHSHGPVPRASRQVRLILAALLVPALLATIVGLVVLWPQDGPGRPIDPTAETSGMVF